jgi:hypothetical protein
LPHSRPLRLVSANIARLNPYVDYEIELRTPARVVFLLREREGFSSEETAGLLGLWITAVKTCLMCARLKLRQKLSVWSANRAVLPLDKAELRTFLSDSARRRKRTWR